MEIDLTACLLRLALCTAAALPSQCLTASAQTPDLTDTFAFDAIARSGEQPIYEELILKDRLQARWQALDVTNRSLAAAEEEGWSLMAGVSDATVDALFNVLEGTKIVHRGSGLMGGTEVRLTSLDITPGVGALDASLRLEAVRGPLTIALKAEGAVMITGIEHALAADDREMARITFRIEPSWIAPSAQIGSLEVPAQGFWTRLAPELATALLSPGLFERTLEIPAEISIQTGIDQVRSETFGENNSAAISYRISMPETNTRLSVIYAAPLYAGDAIWLLAKEGAQAPDPILRRKPESDNADTLRAEIKRLDADVHRRLSAAGMPSLATTERGIALRINGTAVERAAGFIGALPSEKRLISIQMTARSGDLYQNEWRDDILGEGGIRAYPACPACGAAAIQIWEPAVQWEAEHVSLTVPISATARLDLAVHVDPLIGGGVGTSVGLEGSTEGQQGVRLNGSTRVVSDEAGRRIAVADWEAACDKVEVRATTDGRLQLNLGWMNLPKVGAKIGVVAGPSVLKPVLLWDEAPTLVELPEPQRLAETGTLADWELLPSVLGAIVTMKPVTVSTEDRALTVVADLGMEMLPRPNEAAIISELLATKRTEVTASREAVAAATQARLEALSQESRCDQKPDFAVLIGSIEIGENNEVVKFLRNAWSDIVNGPGPSNDMVKFLDRMGVDFHKVAAVADTVAKDGVPEVTIRENGQVEVELPLNSGVSTHGGHGGIGVEVKILGGKIKL